jgi:RNA polymerase sigma-70 factor (ECF subfamily)
MDNPEADVSGPFAARYLAFLETITYLRASLHRYCSRMTGSVLDGEDVVQEALFQAYRKLETFDDARPLAPWLFRIAHNRCIDFLRSRGLREEAEAAVAVPDVTPAVDPAGPALGRAVEHLVLSLPPKERACVLLKDVFDYSLEEIAELVDSTVGGVKAALNRGRSKLARLRAPMATTPLGHVEDSDALTPARPRTQEDLRVLHLYVERFNQRDWDGLRELIAADARLCVADRFAGRVVESPYFTNYERVTPSWRMAVGDVDGEAAVIVLHAATHGWTTRAIVRIAATGGQILRIADYSHCPWVIPAATHVSWTAGPT